MRLPFPERLSILPVLVFCLVLAMLQQLQGTTLLFSGCTAAFILMAAVAFNVTGGMTRPSGGFIFSYAVFAVIFGITYKVLVGEPGQSNLLQPERTVEVYAATMAGMLVAAYLAQRFRSKRSLLPKFGSLEEMYRACVGLLMLGAATLASEYLGFGNAESGSLLSIFYRLDVFLPLSIFLGVTYEIRRSGGRQSVNGPVLLAIALSFTNGVVGYSKQGMLTPFVCWLIPVASLRYRVSLLQIAALAAAFGLTSYYLVPYSQYGRNFKGTGGSLQADLRNNVQLLSNLGLVRSIYTQQMAEIYAGDDAGRYYNKPQGLADRIQMITADDAVISYTEDGGVFGLFPTIFSFENLIPHIIWPSKPGYSFGNIYAHELGIIGDEEDNTTGISFSPSGDAFHQAKWVGVGIVLPLLAFMMFYIVDSLCGDTRDSPFPLLILLLYLHAAPEGGITQFAPLAFSTMFQVFLMAYLSTKVMPLLASLVLGPAKEPMGWVAPAIPRPARVGNAAEGQMP